MRGIVHEDLIFFNSFAVFCLWYSVLDKSTNRYAYFGGKCETAVTCSESQNQNFVRQLSSSFGQALNLSSFSSP